MASSLTLDLQVTSHPMEQKSKSIFVAQLEAMMPSYFNSTSKCSALLCQGFAESQPSCR